MSKTVAFEIGTEELPALELYNVDAQLEKICTDKLNNQFKYKDIEIHTTPRRIIILIHEVEEIIEGKCIMRRGPKVSIGFDDSDQPTKATLGFAKGAGVDVKDLVVDDFKGQKYLFANIVQESKNVIDILPNLLLDIVNAIPWKRTMRWGTIDDEFARPVRWILALFGNSVIDLSYGGVQSSNFTYGHRFLSKGKIYINNADELLDKLNDSFVITNTYCRKKTILKQVKDIEKSTELSSKIPPAVLNEVVNLCEYPTCMVGEFDKLFLSVPKEIIVDAMLVHQRYFPLFDKDKLSNKFIIISNGDKKYEENIVYGNECVVNARLYDAKFFYDEDNKQPLESYVDKLDQLVFQDELGTMKDKTLRLEKISKHVSKDANSHRAAYLSKADLVTNAVVEFSSVQGIMGGYYAKNSGEDPEVCCAISTHYCPKFAGDNLPANYAGCIVALCDKIDTICGMFSINKLPTGSSDPFALRRAAIGVINILQSAVNIPLLDLIDYSLELYEKQGLKFNKKDVFNNVLDFFVTRAKVMLKENKIAHDVIEAVFSINKKHDYELLELINRAYILNTVREENSGIFDDLAAAFMRANNLRDASLGIDYDLGVMNDEEKKLIECLNNTDISNDFKDSLKNISLLRAPIDSFFDNVMIMDKNNDIKNNRIKILNAFCDKFSCLADFSKMAKK